jgi:hypothetical protein
MFYTCKHCNAKVIRPLKHFNKVHARGEKVIAQTNEFLEANFIKEPFFYSGFSGSVKSRRKRSNTVVKSTISEAGCKDYGFIWDDIIFKNKSVQIYIKRLDKRFLEIDCKNSIESLNKIKEEFFTKHHGNKLYKLKAYDNKVMLIWSKDVQDILALTEAAIEFYEFRYEKAKKVRYLSEEMLESISNEDILKLFKQTSDKEPYLKFLYHLHSEYFKLIPILEFIGNTQEESFLFRIKNGNEKILVVWENLNPARATYLFQLKEGSLQFKNILTYISEHEQSKRLFLRQDRNKVWASTHLGYVGFIEHTGLVEYKKLIMNYIKLK